MLSSLKRKPYNNAHHYPFACGDGNLIDLNKAKFRYMMVKPQSALLAAAPTRRTLLLAGGALLLAPKLALAGPQREETLSDDVASVMRSSVANVSPPRLVFEDAVEGKRWLAAMSARLARFVPDEAERHRLLTYIQYESTRAGLNTQVVLGLIEVESAFRQYAISNVGARGLMQVMPFWKNHIGQPGHNLFDVRTNLRYGCTILRHYRNVERGDMVRALARFNGSLGSMKYPNAVLGAHRNRWQWA